MRYACQEAKPSLASQDGNPSTMIAPVLFLDPMRETLSRPWSSLPERDFSPSYLFYPDYQDYQDYQDNQDTGARWGGSSGSPRRCCVQAVPVHYSVHRKEFTSMYCTAYVLLTVSRSALFQPNKPMFLCIYHTCICRLAYRMYLDRL